MDLNIFLIEDPKIFKRMRTEWNALLVESEMNNPFLTWEWMNSWWEIYGKNARLYIITVRNNEGKLIGIGPFKLISKGILGFRRTRVLEFIGTGGDVISEYLDIIVKIGHEKEVTFCILNYIFKNKLWSKIDLRHFASTSNTIQLFKEWLNFRDFSYNNDTYSICPYANLPKSMDDFFSEKSPNFRKKMKEYMRISKRDLDLIFFKCRNYKQLRQGMLNLRKLHKKRWGWRSRAFNTKRYRRFHDRISRLFMENDWLRLFFLKDNELYIAGIYCFFYNNKYFYLQSGRDLAYSKYRLGYVLLNNTLQEAIKENASEFDFLTGNETYKFRWAQHVRKTIRLSFPNPERKNSFSHLIARILEQYIKKFRL